jgi:phage tail sheath gpL-like
MAILSLFLNTGRLASPIGADKFDTLVALKNTIGQLEAGGMDTMTLRTDVTPVAASGIGTISSGAGTITATINGVAIAITWATSDANSAALLAAAINASTDALVSGIVTATSLLGVVTISAVVKGKAGNAITLAASGTGTTAGGARLTSGSNGTSTTFTY